MTILDSKNLKKNKVGKTNQSKDNSDPKKWERGDSEKDKFEEGQLREGTI